MKKNLLTFDLKSIITKNKNIYILLIALFFALCSNAQTTAPFTASGTWLCPAGVTTIQVEAYGGGGGGGFGGPTSKYGGGGGGGGAYSINSSVTVVPGTTYNITVGAGGARGVSATQNGAAGVASTAIFGATTVTALPGQGGLSYSNGRTGGAGGLAGTYSGGNGVTGSTTYSGGGGGCGGATGNGSIGVTSTAGTGGGGVAGNGGNGSTNNSKQGQTGISFGGGGGGGTGASNGGNGASGYVLLTYFLTPTITSFSPSSLCYGDTITINGTNLTGALASGVKIGGTSVTSIISNNGTTIVATVGSGNTGVISVTISGHTGNSISSVTVNPKPIITTQPTNPGAICAVTGSASLSVVASGATTYQWQNNGINLTNGTVFSGVNTSTLNITGPAVTDSGNYTVVVSNVAGCSVTSTSVAITVNPIPTVVITPSPSDASTGICYSGAGAITSLTWAASVGATSYDVYIGAGSLPGTPTTNVLTNSYTTGTLLGNTTYYWKIVAKNGCGGAVGSSTWIFTTTTGPCSCNAGGTVSGTNYLRGFISNVTFNTINNSTGFDGYINTGINTNVYRGIAYTLKETKTVSGYKTFTEAWIDWNNDGDFADAGEIVMTSANSTITGSETRSVSVTIPAGATLGTTRMRVMVKYNAAPTATGCDTSTVYMDVEDYYITILPTPVCTTPTSQPTLLNVYANGNGLSGSFTAPSPASDSYLVVINTTGTIPVPVNGVIYAIGSTIGAGNTVIGNSSSTSFATSGLSLTTLYHVYIYSFNGNCSGGPLYDSTTPLSGSITTLSTAYCIPSVKTAAESSGGYFIDVKFVGTLNDTNNSSTYATTAPYGYQDFTNLPNIASQAVGQGVNIFIQSLYSGYYKAWVDWNNDGDFTDTGEQVYDSGVVSEGSTTFGFVIPIGTPIGNYRVRIRENQLDGTYTNANSTNVFDSCNQINYIGETEDYIFSVVPDCGTIITSVTDGLNCGTGAVALNVTGSVGTTQFKWYDSKTGGNLLATTTTGTWTTPSLSTTTTYYVTAVNGCESLVRTAIKAIISPIATLSFTPSNPTVCGENSVVNITAGGDTQQVYLINEDFEGGTLGTMNEVRTGVDNGTYINGYSAWQNFSSTYVPAYVSSIPNTWFPAIASGYGTNHFAVANSDNGEYLTGSGDALTSATVNSTSFTDLTLTFDLFYDRYYVDGNYITYDYVNVDVSTNGGTTWTTIKQYTKDVGYGTTFVTQSIDMSSYIGVTNLKIRINYVGIWCNGVAVDNVKLFGTVPLVTAFNWVSATPVQAFSDLACTIPYVAGTPIITVYVKPTLAQLQQGVYTFTASVTVANGCPVSKDITITNTSRVWQGISTDWNDPNNWLPVGVPTSSNCVIIPTTTSIISGTNYNGYGKNLTIKNGGDLELLSNNNLTITDFMKIESGGVFNVKDSGSFIQINNVTNTVNGTFNMERITRPMYSLDYTYWNSPLKAGSFTLGSLSPGSSLMWAWTPSVSSGNGNWIFQGAGTIMDPTKGYIVRAPNSFSSNPATRVPFTANFIGDPNNGDVLMPITYGTLGPFSTGIVNDKYNLIGNPYPSAISAASFLSYGANPNIIDGTIYFWTHNSPPSTLFPNPFYGTYLINYTEDDYASWNKTGPTATMASTGGGIVPSGNIAAGESFFTIANTLSPSGTNVTFNNAMRITNFNNQFFKNANPVVSNTVSNENIERHRIWLNLSGVNIGSFSQILVGYIEGATNDGYDRDFDGYRFGGDGLNFYSIATERPLCIQGRALPFVDSDQVALGYTANTAGTYTISLDRVDGLFDNQDIYLEDHLLNNIQNLKNDYYEFDTDTGNFDTRFTLRYTDNTLANHHVVLDNDVKVVVNQKVSVRSTQSMKNIVVYDLLGRTIDSYSNINTTQLILNNLNKTESGLIIKITLDNNIVVTKKIVF